ncbi:MAG: glycerophosphodiester phosphodiesterase [Gammaproteobacteria bacterium]|nr:glycerophosphodiester phosphodiesterase [Gammaproteobacteria bacterium]
MPEVNGRPQLIAHRGAASRFPENSLIGIEAALRAGARHVEIDIQLSSDGVPMVLHDEHLERITGLPGSVFDLSAQALRTLPSGEPERLGSAFPGARLVTLHELVALWLAWPSATLWVEVKEESIRRFGTAHVLRAVLNALLPIAGRFVLISYDHCILDFARERHDVPIGWVLHTYDEASRHMADRLRPNFMICNVTKITPEGLWPGPWLWALYEFTDLEAALFWHRRGARFIESMAVTELLRDPRWRMEDS